MSSEFITLKKHPVVHAAQKGDTVSQNHVRAIVDIVEALLAKPRRICDAQSHLQQFLETETAADTEEWPSAEDINMFSSIPKGWLWDDVQSNQLRFGQAFMKVSELKSKGILRETMILMEIMAHGDGSAWGSQHSP